jgi:putative FmdB family regulatory protein
MPLYEYRCTSCGHRFEVLQPVGAGNETLTCPQCGLARPERQLSTFAASTKASDAGCGASGCAAASGFT